MIEANDRSFGCLLLEDCCGATDIDNHRHTVKMIGDRLMPAAADLHLRRDFGTTLAGVLGKA